MCNKAIAAATSMLCAVAMLATSHTRANSFHSDQVQTVQEMIGIDARIALANERKRLHEATGRDRENELPATAEAADVVKAQPEPVVLPSDFEEPTVAPETVELVGIFGLEHELYADVLINDRRVRFKQGSARAERQTADFPYRLKFIAPPCAAFTNNGEEVSVCLGGEG